MRNLRHSPSRDKPLHHRPPPRTSESRFGDAIRSAAEAGDSAELQLQSHGVGRCAGIGATLRVTRSAMLGAVLGAMLSAMLAALPAALRGTTRCTPPSSSTEFFNYSAAAPPSPSLPGEGGGWEEGGVRAAGIAPLQLLGFGRVTPVGKLRQCSPWERGINLGALQAGTWRSTISLGGDMGSAWQGA